MGWNVEFFEEDSGRQPVRDWLTSLESGKRAAAIAAVEIVLTHLGLDVCGTEHGKQLGQGLFEFRIRHDEGVQRRKAGLPGKNLEGAPSKEVLVRLFCHAHGDKVVLLLGGYDKGQDSSPRRQQQEIELARKRLRTFKLRQRRARSGSSRRR